MTEQQFKEHTARMREYYDGPASNVYREMWQDNMHMGTWVTGKESIYEAMEQTNAAIGKEAGFEKDSLILDAGCGYGKTARYFAKNYGCRVIGITIGEEERRLAEERANAEGLADRVEFRYGDYQDLDFEDATFDVVFSQEAFLHGDDKNRILTEAFRVLKPGGRLIFTDILVEKDIPEADRARIYDRIKSSSIWDAPDYVQGLKEAGFRILRHEDWQAKVAPTYDAMLQRIRDHKNELEKQAGSAFIESTIAAYEFWVNAARDGKIGQAFFIAEKPA